MKIGILISALYKIYYYYYYYYYLIMCYNYKDLYGINKLLLLINELGDPSLLFPNLSSCDINNQLAKFEKNFSVGSISVE